MKTGHERIGWSFYKAKRESVIPSIGRWRRSLFILCHLPGAEIKTTCASNYNLTTPYYVARMAGPGDSVSISPTYGELQSPEGRQCRNLFIRLKMVRHVCIGKRPVQPVWICRRCLIMYRKYYDQESTARWHCISFSVLKDATLPNLQQQGTFIWSSTW